LRALRENPTLQRLVRQLTGQDALAHPVLTLHIGLPKTATSFLQMRVFRSEKNLTYIHGRTRGPLERLLQVHQRMSKHRFEERIKPQLLSLLPAGDVLVSDENIAMRVGEPWKNKGPTPASFGPRLGQLQTLVGTVRVILGVRRQDHWLASRYAESARLSDEYSQEDFERWAAMLCAGTPVKGALNWLDFARAERSLRRCLGRENLLVLPMEALEDDTERVIGMIEQFVGVSGWLDNFRSKPNKKRVNVLSIEPNTWRFKGRPNKVLRLTETTSKALLARYESTNRELNRRIDFDLQRYGYY
jgi:hypothetical protein